MAHMTSCLRRFGITLAFLGFASILPATVGAQPPVYLTQWGSYGQGDGQFFYPTGVAIDAAGDVYVADLGNSRIQKFTGTGTYLTQWGSPGTGNGQVTVASGVAADAAGDVYVPDLGNGRIQKCSGEGTYLTQWPGSGHGIATDAAGNVYVTYGDGIQKFTGTGTLLTEWASLGSGDGQFKSPYGVARDAAGGVYVADSGNHRIQKFGPDLTPTKATTWGRLKS